jgi:hypothetical protein
MTWRLRGWCQTLGSLRHKDSMIGIFAIQGLVQTLSREIEHANTE